MVITEPITMGRAEIMELAKAIRDSVVDVIDKRPKKIDPSEALEVAKAIKDSIVSVVDQKLSALESKMIELTKAEKARVDGLKKQLDEMRMAYEKGLRTIEILLREQKTPHNTINVSPTPLNILPSEVAINNEVNVSPTPIKVTNEVSVEPTPIEVNVPESAAPIINNSVVIPPRKMVKKEILYNSDGYPAEVTETEVDE